MPDITDYGANEITLEEMFECRTLITARIFELEFGDLPIKRSDRSKYTGINRVIPFDNQNLEAGTLGETRFEFTGENLNTRIVLDRKLTPEKMREIVGHENIHALELEQETITLLPAKNAPRDALDKHYGHELVDVLFHDALSLLREEYAKQAKVNYKDPASFKGLA